MKLAGKKTRIRASIIPKMQSSSYQRSKYCEFNPTNNVFPTLSMLPLHQATNAMYANIPVAIPEAIQSSYNMLCRSIQNPITLQQQSNIDMWFNSCIDQERNHNVQVYVFLGAHNTINENQFVLSSLSSCDARVFSYYGCNRPLNIIMADGSKRISDPPFDLVLITKMHREYRKDGEFRQSSEFRNVYFHAKMTWAVRFVCLKQKVNLNEKSTQIDSRMLPILNALHVGFITFTLKLDHLVNSIKKVKWNTAVRIPYLTIRPKFDRKKSLYAFFFYIDTYKGLSRRTKLIFCYAWTSVFQMKVP